MSLNHFDTVQGLGKYNLPLQFGITSEADNLLSSIKVLKQNTEQNAFSQHFKTLAEFVLKMVYIAT